jgi:uncharacterized protein (DUF1697 family)
VSDLRVALLRGINVGKAKRVAMADLRALVESLGYGDVRTLLNSGNVVFSAPERVDDEGAAKRIEQGIEGTLGITSRVIVLGPSAFAAVVHENPLVAVATDPSRLMVTVFRSAADRARLVPLTTMEWAPDQLALGTRAAYLWCPSGILESRLSVALVRMLGDSATTRNWSTVSKLWALVGPSER